MPGKPQVWYLDLFVGENDHEAVRRAGEGGHKEINRTNLSMSHIDEALKKEVVTKQLELLRIRNTHPAFGVVSEFTASSANGIIELSWEKEGRSIKLSADLKDYDYEITLG